jgi:hypothetical protein
MGAFQRVDEWTLRGYFNAWKLWEKVQAGEMLTVVYKDRKPGDAAPPDLPKGTKSQEVHYFDTSQGKLRRRAIVHQYLQPDGTIGASGKPDPKWLLGEDGTIYAFNRSQAGK